MATRSFTTTTESPSWPHWLAIWAGAFCFMAIWTVFGSLGVAVFGSAANPAEHPLIGRGPGVWLVILTAVSMFFAGQITGRLAGVVTKADGVMHGMTMFGLSLVGVILMIELGEVAAGTQGQVVRSFNPLANFAGAEWAIFLSLILGWLCSMWGASSVSTRAHRELPVSRPEQRAA